MPGLLGPEFARGPLVRIDNFESRDSDSLDSCIHGPSKREGVDTVTRTVALAVLPIFLVGCIQTRTTTLLVKENISQQQQELDLAECDNDPTALVFAKRTKEEFLRCMKVKGYKETISQ